MAKKFDELFKKLPKASQDEVNARVAKNVEEIMAARALESINDTDREEIRNRISVGDIFACGGKSWKCTDKGQRTIIAIELDHDRDASWYVGPPYAVAETVFDEHDILGIEN